MLSHVINFTNYKTPEVHQIGLLTVLRQGESLFLLLCSK